MNQLQKIAEIQVSYSHPVSPLERIKIDGTEKLIKVLSQVWEKDTLEYRECFYVLLLSRSLGLLGYRQLST